MEIWKTMRYSAMFIAIFIIISAINWQETKAFNVPLRPETICDAGVQRCSPFRNAAEICNSDGSTWVLKEDCSAEKAACTFDGITAFCKSIDNGSSVSNASDSTAWLIVIIFIGGLLWLLWYLKNRSYAANIAEVQDEEKQKEEPKKIARKSRFCSKCGNKLQIGVKFCGKCGSKV